jgi:hypothetical protein
MAEVAKTIAVVVGSFAVAMLFPYAVVRYFKGRDVGGGGGITAALLGALVLAGVTAHVLINGVLFHVQVPTCPGVYEAGAVVEGQAFILLDRLCKGGRTAVGHYPELAIVDLETGRRAAVRLSTAWNDISLSEPPTLYHFIGVGRGMVWLHSTDLGVHARDPRTGALLVREDEIVARTPVLAAGTARQSGNDYYQLDHDSGDLCLERSDHFIVRLNPLTFDARVLAPSERGCQSRHHEPPGPPVSPIEAKVVEERVGFAGAPRAQLVVRGHTLGSATWFEPRMLEASAGHPIGIDGPLSVVVAHSLDDRGVSLSRVSLGSGEVLWSSPLPRGEVAEQRDLKMARVFGASLIVLTDLAAYALDTATGQMRWSARY